VIVLHKDHDLLRQKGNTENITVYFGLPANHTIEKTAAISSS